MRRALLTSLAFAIMLSRTAAAQLVNENLLVEVPPGYKIDFQDRKTDMLINEMVRMPPCAACAHQ